ncbi:MAG: response regulator [Sphingobacteriaceae bacterium]|nr:MAG: response regulator [Sphingobacteriaceae bacterium]
MKTVLIIDDEPLARSIVQEYLMQYPQINVAQECGDGFEGVKAIIQHKPDLIFLDVQMPKINGFEMLELVDQQPSVIFTTAFDEYALKAFEAHAVDYLLKPFSKERFNKAIDKFLDQPKKTEATTALLETASSSPAQHDRIVVKTGTKIKVIPIQEVIYLEAADDYVNIHTATGEFLKNKTMSFFEQILDPTLFTRVHRSYIVRVEQIVRIDPYEKETHILILKSGAKIPVSKAGYAKLKLVLGI